MSELRLQKYVDTNRDEIIERLFGWLRIPSVSTQPAHANDVQASATYCAQLMKDAGLENVEILSAGGKPAVYGDWLHAGDRLPTALVYGHHDVQPVDPVEEWTSPPFEPVIVDGEFRARGASDDKGQIAFQIEAIRGLLSVDGTLPMNIKFLIEGEEEIGSPTLENILVNESQRLECDVIVISDTGMWATDIPSICIGMRGLVAFDVEVRTAEIDVHSGSFGGAVPNSAHVIAQLVADLHDDNLMVTIPGFYHDVIAPSASERASIDSLPFNEARFMEQAKVKATTGEKGQSTLDRIWTRPTCEITGITVGYGGEGIKTIVPARGGFKVVCRLVANQDPQKISESFREWISTRTPPGVEIKINPEGAVAPALTRADHPANEALVKAITKVWGIAPVFTREGGSGPEEGLGRLLNAPLIYLGVMLPDDRYHAPNERIMADQFWRGLLTAGELWSELSTYSPSIPG